MRLIIKAKYSGSAETSIKKRKKKKKKKKKKSMVELPDGSGAMVGMVG